MSTHSRRPVLRGDERVGHAQLGATGLPQPSGGGFDAASPVGALRVDDPESDELSEGCRVAFLAESQHPYCRSSQQFPPAGVVVLAVNELAFRFLAFVRKSAVADPRVGEGLDRVCVVRP
ncbi:hypothetical protein ACF09J_35280 [Streptomyces sp. NPDC014889]|uniref:hypothetical protein n=1 Tax=Streptomyces sp. NPDC014889 TaxID=3364928 RepID=UPI0036FD4F57